MKKQIAAVGLVMTSAAAFAETSPVASMDVTPIVTSINAVVPNLVLVGGAVLAVAAVAWGYKVVKGFIGR
ncbi:MULTISPECIES: major capsid protein [Burkholderia]|uniref:major capsid protein n=1 Tax=Burkholderia TaxID=32008 RepID=UPI00075E3C91|nr:MULTISPECIES: major capsid protein [Burkholderia]KVG41309.1 coat protein [Burkholderia sp. MSMB0265]KVG84431.1 coat protein [Burkholderia sp. MSMB2040]KVG95609.1 coat protein [Burkholderia sp. MSMB2041]KVH01235.1 coat protein [Burkholderia sp. MSMB2042]